MRLHLILAALCALASGENFAHSCGPPEVSGATRQQFDTRAAAWYRARADAVVRATVVGELEKVAEKGDAKSACDNNDLASAPKDDATSEYRGQIFIVVHEVFKGNRRVGELTLNRSFWSAPLLVGEEWILFLDKNDDPQDCSGSVRVPDGDTASKAHRYLKALRAPTGQKLREKQAGQPRLLK